MRRSALYERAQKTLIYELFDAGRDGDIKAAKEALERGLEEGADINGRTKEGRTLLQEACLQGHAGVARLLLWRGASPHVKDNNGLTTPEYIMGMDCAYDRERVMETLVEKYPEYADKLPKGKATGGEAQTAVTQLQGG